MKFKIPWGRSNPRGVCRTRCEVGWFRRHRRAPGEGGLVRLNKISIYNLLIPNTRDWVLGKGGPRDPLDRTFRRCFSSSGTRREGLTAVTGPVFPRGTADGGRGHVGRRLSPLRRGGKSSDGGHVSRPRGRRTSTRPSTSSTGFLPARQRISSSIFGSE